MLRDDTIANCLKPHSFSLFTLLHLYEIRTHNITSQNNVACNCQCRINLFNKHEPEAGDTVDRSVEPPINDTTVEQEPAVALIAVDDAREELSATSGMADESLVPPSRGVPDQNVSTASE